MESETRTDFYSIKQLYQLDCHKITHTSQQYLINVLFLIDLISNLNSALSTIGIVCDEKNACDCEYCYIFSHNLNKN